MNIKKKSINNIVNITTNKKAYYNFLIEKKMECGLILKGWEVKSIRKNKVNIQNSYLFFQQNELYLFGINIQPITNNNICVPNLSKQRNIKVLLNKKEIQFLYSKYKTKGYSLIALSLYWKRAWCKIQIAVSIGKTKYDQRIDKKNKEWLIQKNVLMKKLLK